MEKNRTRELSIAEKLLQLLPQEAFTDASAFLLQTKLSHKSATQGMMPSALLLAQQKIIMLNKQIDIENS